MNCPRCGKDVSIGGAHTCRPKANCRGEEFKVGDRIWVSVKDEHKNTFFPESIHNFSGFIWQIDDEHVYVKSSSGALNRYPWWAIDYKTGNDIEQPEPEQDERIRDNKIEKLIRNIMRYTSDDEVEDIVNKIGIVRAFIGTSRNAEIEEKDRIINEWDKLNLEQKKKIESLEMKHDFQQIIATKRAEEIATLKAEIKSMRCCGNCGQEELPKEDKTCNSCKRGVEWSDADNWTRKPK